MVLRRRCQIVKKRVKSVRGGSIRVVVGWRCSWLLFLLLLRRRRELHWLMSGRRWASRKEILSARDRVHDYRGRCEHAAMRCECRLRARRRRNSRVKRSRCKSSSNPLPDRDLIANTRHPQLAASGSTSSISTYLHLLTLVNIHLVFVYSFPCKESNKGWPQSLTMTATTTKKIGNRHAE